MSRSILHMDLDSFFVSVERLKDKSLVGKPLIIGGVSDRGVVASCSYEARYFGVRSAMPIMKAKQLCPQAIIMPGSMHDYAKYSAMVTAIIEENAPIYEKSSIDEFYIDITGMDRFFGCYKWATELRNKIIDQTGLPISMGLSSGKTVSKIATGESKPNGQLHVLPGTEKEFLAPLPLSRMPMAGEVTCEFFKKRGIHTIGQLAAISKEQLIKLLGKHGEWLWEKANGLCNSPVVPYHIRKSISSETTFREDKNEAGTMIAILNAMAEKLCFNLRSAKQTTSCVAVKVRYSNFDTFTQQNHINASNQDGIIIKTAIPLFKKLYNPHLKVRLIGLRLGELSDAAVQTNLFSDNVMNLQLSTAVDGLRKKYGWQAVNRAASLTKYRLA